MGCGGLQGRDPTGTAHSQCLAHDPESYAFPMCPAVPRGFGSRGMQASGLGGVAHGRGVAIYGPWQGGGLSLEAQTRGTLVGLT